MKGSDCVLLEELCQEYQEDLAEAVEVSARVASGLRTEICTRSLRSHSMSDCDAGLHLGHGSGPRATNCPTSCGFLPSRHVTCEVRYSPCLYDPSLHFYCAKFISLPERSVA
jgi:hypothetical protein